MDDTQPVPVDHLQGLLNKKIAQRTYLQGLVTSNGAVPFTHPAEAAPVVCAQVSSVLLQDCGPLRPAFSLTAPYE
jgi:hypothetical protein